MKSLTKDYQLRTCNLLVIFFILDYPNSELTGCMLVVTE
jgi:hypothetical protein